MRVDIVKDPIGIVCRNGDVFRKERSAASLIKGLQERDISETNGFVQSW